MVRCGATPPSKLHVSGVISQVSQVTLIEIQTGIGKPQYQVRSSLAAPLEQIGVEM